MALRIVLALLALACMPAAAPVSAQALPKVVLVPQGPIADDPKVRARMRVTVGGRRAYAGFAGVEVRGRSSQQFPKQSFALETRTRSGDNRDVRLLGLPRENDWVLYASYNEKSLVRHAVGFRAARRLGRYAPRTRFVELWLGGAYQGVFVLMEKPKLDQRRVAGDYLIELTDGDDVARKPEEHFTTPLTGRPFLYEDPPREDLSGEQARYVARYVARAERALFGDAFRHPRRGWRRYFDEDALVDHVLLTELFKVQDGFDRSTFLAKHRGRKLAFGPLWDLDVAMGNSNYDRSGTLEGWQLAGRPWGGDRFYRDPDFVRAFAHRWHALRRDGLLARLRRDVRRSARSVSGAQERNFARWPVLGTYVWPNPVVHPTWEAEVGYLEDWLERRVAWIDANLPQLRADADD